MSDGIIEWNADAVVADTMVELASRMEEAAEFVEGRAKSLVPTATGRLKDEITHVVIARHREVIAQIGIPRKNKAFYAFFVEMGTSQKPASPFLRPALYNHVGEIKRILGAK